MYSAEDLTLFVKKNLREDRVSANSDIFKELGVVGDDFHELMEEYIKEYSVDMSSYLWYFHADEEGFGLGALFFKPPYRRVARIPVTPMLLTEFANSGKWQIDYPEHTLPRRRYDIIINQIIAITFLILLIAQYFVN